MNTKNLPKQRSPRKIHMNKEHGIGVKLLSAALLLSLVVGICSCKKDAQAMPKEPILVNDDEVWFDSTRVEITPRYLLEDVDYMESILLSVDDDAIFVRNTGALAGNESVPYGSSELMVEEIVKYSYSGEVLSVLDIKAEIAANYSNYETFVEDFACNSNSIIILINLYDYSSNSISRSKITIDKSTLSVVSQEIVDLECPEDSAYFYVESLFAQGQGVVANCLAYSETDIGTKFFTYLGSDGSVKTIDLKHYLPNVVASVVWHWIDTSAQTGANTAEVYINAGGDSGIMRLEINFDELTCTSFEVQVDANVLWDMYAFANIGGDFYSMEEDALYKVDLDSSEKTEVLSYSDAFVDAYEISRLGLVECTDDRIVIGGFISDHEVKMGMRLAEGVFYILERAEVNPNVGETVLRVGFVGVPYSYAAISHAAYIYNMQSEDAVICFEFYDEEDYLSYDVINGASSTSSMYGEEVRARSELTNAAAIDIMSGDGPDIIINADDIYSLGTSEYLYDMSNFYFDVVPEGELFDNVVMGCFEGDSLYYMPLNFSLSGIATNATRLADEDSIGFTFEEYAEFCDRECMHMDPIGIYTGRLEFVDMMVNAQGMDAFVGEGGEVHFDCEAFYGILSYALENVDEEPRERIADSYELSNSGMGPAWSCTFESVDDFAIIYRQSEITNGNINLYGYPSVEQMGAQIDISTSVAISANSANIDLCVDFVSLLISEEGQLYDTSSYTPINRAVFEVDAEAAIVRQNHPWEYMLSLGYTEEEIRASGMILIDEQMTVEFEELVSRSHVVSEVDPAIIQIINEEIGAFFAEQKTLEEVALIINNRAQTVINER